MIAGVPTHIARYALLDEIASRHDDEGLAFFRGHDEVLDRPVSIRLLRDDDPRAAAFVGAARAAALVDDRRLLRVLDIITVPAGDDHPALVAVVSEWARGLTIDALVTARAGERMPIDEAVALVDDVAHAVSAGVDAGVSHGRLHPGSVIVTDAGEVRVRGLAVDAALFGPLTDDLTGAAADVDGLGRLLYLLVTGTNPGPQPIDGLPDAARSGGLVLPPSHVRADVPGIVDDAVARSMADARRPRGQRNVPDARAFAAMLAVTRDQVAAPQVGARRPVATPMAMAARVAVAVVALAAAVGLGVLGWLLLRGGPQAAQTETTQAEDSILTSPVVTTITEEGIERLLPIAAVRSFDPFGDDDGNGKADGRKGRENEDDIALATDGDQLTGWSSDRYRAADFDGKPGVGVVVDLGTEQPVREVGLVFAEAGAPVEVRVADRVYRDPGTWNLLARTDAGGDQIAVRAPRPLVGRYVLLWFPQAPDVTGWGRYQVGLNEITVIG